MYPDAARHQVRRQRGFLMPLALFIVLGLGALALVISRLNSNGFSVAISEGLSVQALYAAESGAQYGMNQLLFDATSSAQVDARCTAVQGQTLTFTAAGLSACSANLSCAKTTVTAGTQAYEITSQGQCGSGAMLTERTIIAGATYD